MKYWKFDVINLIADYHVNENAVATLKLQLREAKNEKKHPFVDTDRDMLNRRIQQIECKIQEYQMYVDMSGNLDEVTQRAKTNEVKMFEMADKANKAEIENESLKSQIEELKHELATLTDSNNFYKNLIDKVNATK